MKKLLAICTILLCGFLVFAGPEQNLIVDPSFELNDGSWQSTWPSFHDDDFVRTGDYSWEIGDTGPPESIGGSVYQTGIPVKACKEYKLGFYYTQFSEGEIRLIVEVDSHGNGFQVIDSINLPAHNPTQWPGLWFRYQSDKFHATAETVSVRIRVEEQELAETGGFVWLDDVDFIRATGN